MPQLAAELKTAVLNQLNLPEQPPTLRYLDQLIGAYIRTVPWESAFRMVRRYEVEDTAVCPRWPEIFWQQHMEFGSGGTCFESNYAFLALLQALGYEGYLTINNMGERVGVHTAIVIRLDGQKWLVDAGLPLYAPLPISPRGVMFRTTPFLAFAVRPDGANRYQIERWPHPQLNAFTLVDEPVDDAAYRQALTADYGESGLFLDRVVINKIIDDVSYRFNMWELPWAINQFGWGTRTDIALNGDPATAVARHFNMDETTVRRAFALSQPPPPAP